MSLTHRISGFFHVLIQFTTLKWHFHKGPLFVTIIAVYSILLPIHNEVHLYLILYPLPEVSRSIFPKTFGCPIHVIEHPICDINRFKLQCFFSFVTVVHNVLDPINTPSSNLYYPNIDLSNTVFEYTQLLSHALSQHNHAFLCVSLTNGFVD